MNEHVCFTPFASAHVYVSLCNRMRLFMQQLICVFFYLICLGGLQNIFRGVCMCVSATGQSTAHNPPSILPPFIHPPLLGAYLVRRQQS